MKSKIIDILLIVNLVFKKLIYNDNFLNEAFVLVTASDEKHYIYLKQLIKNYEKLIKSRHFTKFIIYDIGLSNKQIQEILNFNFIDLRKFPFEKYPEFYSLRLPEHNNKIGGFAWKPAIINTLKEEKFTNVIWLDSATIFDKKIIFFKYLIAYYGFGSFYSTGSISDWTHNYVIEKLDLKNNFEVLQSPNLLAGVTGFSFRKQEGVLTLEKWNNYSSQKDLIFPKNSSTSNHRHDQSLLSITHWLSTKRKLPSNTELFGIKIQNWPNKILFFYDEKKGIREKLLKKYYFESTTTNSRCKILILFNVESLKKIPIRLIFRKKVLLFITNTDQLNLLNRYYIKKNFLQIYLDNGCKNINNYDYNIIDFQYDEVDKIIEKEYKIEFYGKK